MIARLAAALLLVAAPSFAQSESWPALFDVSGVQNGDVLNIRARPTTDAEIIGTFAPNKTEVEVIEPSQDGAWGKIGLAENTGWVSLTFLTRQPGQWSGTAPETAFCLGTEPFWSLDLEPSLARFKTPEALPLEFTQSASLRSRNRTDRHSKVFENDLGGLVATLANATCSDGMSNRDYGWAIDVLLFVAGDGNAQMFSGCCTLAR